MQAFERGLAPRGLVLTAGLGTRLRPLTYVRAKPAVPVNGEPLARRVIRWLSTQGIGDLILNLHHHPASVTAVVGDGADLGTRVRYSWEQPILGSAGGVRHALPLLAEADRDRILLINGDTLTDLRISPLLAAHEASGATVTLAVIPNPRPDIYGGVQVSDEGWITGFTRRGTPGLSYHFIGVQVAEARAFAGLEDGVAAESVGDLYPRLIAASPQSVAAFVCDAGFRDIGTPDDYLRTSLELAGIEGDGLVSPGASIAVSADLTHTVVWNEVIIGPRAHLDHCIVCDGAKIPAEARYRRCAILPADGRTPAAGERIEGTLLIRDF